MIDSFKELQEEGDSSVFDEKHYDKIFTETDSDKNGTIELHEAIDFIKRLRNKNKSSGHLDRTNDHMETQNNLLTESKTNHDDWSV